MQNDRYGNNMQDAQNVLYGWEHWMGWLMAAGAIALGVIGLLIGVNVFDFSSGGPINITANQNTPYLTTDFLHGTMWIFSGISAGILAYTLHASGHHRMGNLNRIDSNDRALYGLEHALAYGMAIVSIVLVVIGVITSYGAFSVSTPELYGLIWVFTGFGSAVVAAAFHAVQHHELPETDAIVDVVVDRVRGGVEVPGARGTAPRRVP